MFFKRVSFSFAFVLALGLGPGVAHATLVVGTGPPANAVGAGWAFNSSHSYAGQFSLQGNMTIDSVQGYFSTEAGNATISLFSNSEDGEGGFIPGSELHASSFATALGALAWNGVSALNWSVSQGTYWIVFSASYSTASQSSMPGMAANPLGGYALQQGGQWFDAAELGLDQGLRVGASATVPEPGSMALFGLGLLAVGFLRRGKQA